MSIVIPLSGRSRRALAPDAAAGQLLVDEEAGFVDFLEDATTVAVWRRRVPALVEAGAKLAATAFRSEFAFRRETRWRASLHADLAASGALSEDEQELLVADVARLAELLDDLVEAPEVGLRLCALGHAMCPRFHVDRVPLRLLCTYAGPGTEWLADADVDRALLRAQVGEAMCDPAMRAGASVRRLAPGYVGLFKGEAWPGRVGRGAVHRSPSCGGRGRRLFLSLEPL
jgi:hypothetical protein